MKLHKKCLIEKVIGKKLIRSPLAAVYLDTAEARVIASNGRALASIPVAVSSHDSSGLITIAALQAARKVKTVTTKRDRYLEITAQEHLSLKDGSTMPRPKEELTNKYPDIKELVTRSKTGTARFTVMLDAAMLFKLAQAMGCKAVELEFRDEHMPIVVTPAAAGVKLMAHAATGTFGLLMPIRLAKEVL